MKLLGMRVDDHDANFCLYDNGVIKYHKSERTTGIKHHAFSNLWEWKYEIEKVLSVGIEELDEICIVMDTTYHGLPQEMKPAFPAQLMTIPNVSCPVWWINHHLAHFCIRLAHRTHMNVL